MAREVISTCPVCSSQLHVTRLHCSTCSTTIEGEFSTGRFALLNGEQRSLLESFLRSRGNLRELERELRVSYPTVRNRVESLLRALGLGEGPPLAGDTAPEPGDIDPAARRTVLERLSRREISAEQAAALLRGEQPAQSSEGANE